MAINRAGGFAKIFTDLKDMSAGLQAMSRLSGGKIKSGLFATLSEALPSPVKIAMIATAIGALVSLIIGITNAIQAAQKNSEYWQKQVDENKGEIDELNGTLETNKKRIEEISKLKGTDQWADSLEDERTELEKQNDALAVRIAYLERVLELENKELNDQTWNELHDSTKHYVYEGDFEDIPWYLRGAAAQSGNTDQISDLEQLRRATDELNRIAKAKENLDVADKNFNTQLKSLEDRERAVNEAIKGTYQNVLSLVESGTGTPTQLAVYKAIVEGIEQAGAAAAKAVPNSRDSFLRSITPNGQKIVEATGGLSLDDGDVLINDETQRLLDIAQRLIDMNASDRLRALFTQFDQFTSGKLSVAEFNDQIKVLLQLIAELQAIDPEKFDDAWVRGLLAIFGLEPGGIWKYDVENVLASKLPHAQYDNWEIKQAISGLSDSELRDFADWLSTTDLEFDTGTGYINAWRKSLDGAGKSAANAAKAFKSMDDMDKFKDQVETLTKAYDSMVSDGRVGFDALKGIKDAFTDEDGNEMVEGLDEYIDRLAELRNDADGTKDVLNELLTSYVQNQLAEHRII